MQYSTLHYGAVVCTLQNLLICHLSIQPAEPKGRIRQQLWETSGQSGSDSGRTRTIRQHSWRGERTAHIGNYCIVAHSASLFTTTQQFLAFWLVYARWWVRGQTTVLTQFRLLAFPSKYCEKKQIYGGFPWCGLLFNTIYVTTVHGFGSDGVPFETGLTLPPEGALTIVTRQSRVSSAMEFSNIDSLLTGPPLTGKEARRETGASYVSFRLAPFPPRAAVTPSGDPVDRLEYFWNISKRDNGLTLREYREYNSQGIQGQKRFCNQKVQYEDVLVLTSLRCGARVGSRKLSIMPPVRTQLAENKEGKNVQYTYVTGF